MSDAPFERQRRGLRASHDDRDHAVDFIRLHAGEGRLTTEELEERVGRALSAKTLGDLDDLVVDLPARPVPAPPPPMPPGRSFLAGPGLRFGVIALFLITLSAPGGGPGRLFLLGLCFAALVLARFARHAERRRRAQARAEARAARLPPALEPTGWEPPRAGGWN
jgi:hypothetical protein